MAGTSRELNQMYITRNLAKKSLRSKRIPARMMSHRHLRSRAIAQLTAGQGVPPPPCVLSFFRAPKRKGHVWSIPEPAHSGGQRETPKSIGRPL
jgi:hypothetical protein